MPARAACSGAAAGRASLSRVRAGTQRPCAGESRREMTAPTKADTARVISPVTTTRDPGEPTARV